MDQRTESEVVGPEEQDSGEGRRGALAGSVCAWELKPGSSIKPWAPGKCSLSRGHDHSDVVRAPSVRPVQIFT